MAVNIWTGGTVVILGRTGRNFAAGMSGGTAYVLDMQGDFATYCNKEIVLLEKLEEIGDSLTVKKMLLQHAEHTGSKLALEILDNWDEYQDKFVKVIPKEYKIVTQKLNEYLQQGMSADAATLKVFEEVFGVILDRKEHPKEGSYTNYLFDKGIDKILKKLGEEATEIVIAAKNPNPEEIKYEISDFLYHMMVLMADRGITWEEITEELANR